MKQTAKCRIFLLKIFCHLFFKKRNRLIRVTCIFLTTPNWLRPSNIGCLGKSVTIAGNVFLCVFYKMPLQFWGELQPPQPPSPWIRHCFNVNTVYTVNTRVEDFKKKENRSRRWEWLDCITVQDNLWLGQNGRPPGCYS